MKRIIISVITIVAVSSAMVGATYALLSDTVTSNGNTFAAGILDLKIRDNDEGYTDGVIGTWTASNIFPGGQWTFSVPFAALVKTVNSVTANHMEITADYTVQEESPQTESDTDPVTNLTPDKMGREMILVKSIYYSGTFCINLLTGQQFTLYNAVGRVCAGSLVTQNTDFQVQDTDADGKISFLDLKNDKADTLPLTQPNGENEAFYIMDVAFDSDANNDLQGDIFNLAMLFTINQAAGQ